MAATVVGVASVLLPVASVAAPRTKPISPATGATEATTTTTTQVTPMAPAAPTPVATLGTAAVSGDRPDLAMAPLADIALVRVGSSRRLVFSTTIVNIGRAPFELVGWPGAPAGAAVMQRVADASGAPTLLTTPAGLVYGGDGHNHWHVKDLEAVDLIRLDNGSKVGTFQKMGYCFFDNVKFRALPGQPDSATYSHRGCGTSTSSEISMGLSVGWGDLYPVSLPDQYIDVTRLSPGRYRLQVVADPYGWFSESDRSNNVTWVDLLLKNNSVRIAGWGPSA